MEKFYHETVAYSEKIPAMIVELGLSDIKRYFPKEIFIPSHWHRSLEISLIENAQIRLQVGQRHTAIENDFTCVNSGEVHTISVISMQENARAILVILSYDFMKQYYPKIDEIQFDLSLYKNHEALDS